MNAASLIRDWARAKLGRELPSSFDGLFEDTRGRLPPDVRGDFEALVMIELAETCGDVKAGRDIAERAAKRLLWRVRKRLQRQTQKRSGGHLREEGVASSESSRAGLNEVFRRRLAAVKDHLTADELLILSRMIDGADASVIQEELRLSRATYYRRLGSIRRKLGRESEA